MNRLPELPPKQPRDPDPYADVLLGAVPPPVSAAVLQIAMSLPAVEASVPRARSTVSSVAGTWGLDVEAIALTVTALVSNAVRAVSAVRAVGKQPIKVTLAVRLDGAAQLDVWNPAPAPDDHAAAQPPIMAETGRGLLLVAAYALKFALVKVTVGTLVRAQFPPLSEEAA